MIEFEHMTQDGRHICVTGAFEGRPPEFEVRMIALWDDRLRRWRGFTTEEYAALPQSEWNRIHEIAEREEAA